MSGCEIMSSFRDQQVEEAAQLAQRMRVLKWVVIVLGVLLVLAMITTVAGVIYKARHASNASNTMGASAMPGGFGQSSIALPKDCQITSATASGDRLIIVTTGPLDTCRLILVTDLKTGRLLGQIDFHNP
jgi:hypothetical protein